MSDAPDTPTLDDLPLWRRLSLGALMFLTTGVMGITQPFMAPYLTEAGLSRWEINLVQGLGTLTAVGVQPLLGRLSDRYDARRPLMLAAALAAALAYLGFNGVPSARVDHTLLTVTLFLLLTVLASNGLQYIGAASGALIGRLAGASRGGSAYARYRLWGSVGYVVVSQVCGRLLPQHPGMTRADLSPAFWALPGILLAIAVLTQLVPDVRTPARPANAPGDVRESVGDPENLNRFLIAFFVYQCSLYGATANLSLFLKDVLHATASDLSTFFAAGVFCEVLVMTQVGRWTDRHGRKPALLAAFCLMPIRLLCYIPASGPIWATAVQSLHGLNYGIVGTIAVTFVNDCAGARNRGTAQARLAATAGLATAVGNWICGFVLQRFGFPAMFAAMSALGALGALLLWRTVRESHPELRNDQRPA